MHPTCVEGSLAHAACVACTVAGCVIVPNVRRNSSGPCARADDALPNRQRSANDLPRGGTVVPPDRAAVLILQASERFSMQRKIIRCFNTLGEMWQNRRSSSDAKSSIDRPNPCRTRNTAAIHSLERISKGRPLSDHPARTSKVATLISFSVFDHHEGTRPQPHRQQLALATRSITASMLVVGNMLKRGCRRARPASAVTISQALAVQAGR